MIRFYIFNLPTPVVVSMSLVLYLSLSIITGPGSATGCDRCKLLRDIKSRGWSTTHKLVLSESLIQVVMGFHNILPEADLDQLFQTVYIP